MGGIFFVGIIVGWGTTYWLLNRSWNQRVAGMKRAIAQRHRQELRQAQQGTEEWTKRSHHLQKTLQARDSMHQERTTQFEHQLQSQQETIHSLTQEKDTLHQQAKTDTIDYQNNVKEWQQKVETIEIDYQSTIKEWQRKAENAEEDAEKLLRELFQKEQEIKDLNLNNQNLAIEVASLNKELRLLKYPDQDSVVPTVRIEADRAIDSHEQIVSQIMEQIDDENLLESLSAMFTRFFPTVHLLRDSDQAIAYVYTAHHHHFEYLISTILYIRNGEYQKLRKHQKIHATNDQWSECRVPHITLLRLYFQKCTHENGYQILISQKHDRKTQKRDFAWLNSQTTC